MMEEALEGEAMVPKDQMLVAKGKRTKRQRPPSPLRLTMVSSSFSSSAGRDCSPAVSAEFVESTEEEEDMANCLILLAQGGSEKLGMSSMPETGDKVVGLYVYQCKTCNRCFSSFQALGGHRASHKRPKGNDKDEKKPSSLMEDNRNVNDRFSKTSTTLSLQLPIRPPLININNIKPKVHECSICGAEFSSGQALGGHMRRHRSFVNTPTNASATAARGGASSSDQSQEIKKERNLLELDLNLPAPEEDHQSKLPFSSKEQVIVFSASPMVECHY